MRDLAWLQTVHLEEINEKHAVLIGSLRSMRGDAPVRDQLRLFATSADMTGRRGPRFAVKTVEAKNRICIADIDG